MAESDDEELPDTTDAPEPSAPTETADQEEPAASPSSPPPAPSEEDLPPPPQMPTAAEQLQRNIAERDAGRALVNSSPETRAAAAAGHQAARNPEPPPWEEVKKDFQEAYPDFDQADIERRYNQALALRKQRRLDDSHGDSYLQRLGRQLGQRMGSSEIGFNWADRRLYNQAQERYNAGDASPDDLDTIAAYERHQREDAEAVSTNAGVAGQTLLRIPGIAAEWFTGKAIVQGAGLGVRAGSGLLGRAISGTAALGATAAVNPSMYAPQWQENNLRAGRDSFDPLGLPGAFGQAMMQTAIFGSLNRIAPNLGGQGLAGVLARGATRTGAGLLEMEAANTVSHVAGWQTGYGSITEMLRGDDQASHHLIGDVLTLAAFAALHEAGGHGTAQERPGNQLATTEAGSPGGEPRPSGPTAGPEGQRNPFDIPTVSAFRDAFNKTLDYFSKNGISQREATLAMNTVMGEYKTVVANNPNISRGDLRRLFENTANPALREFGLAIADIHQVVRGPGRAGGEDNTAPRPQNAPESTPAQEAAQTPPEPAQTPRERADAAEQAHKEALAAENDAKRAVQRANSGDIGSGNVVEARRALREAAATRQEAARQMDQAGQRAAQADIDAARPEPPADQRWEHTGTEFRDRPDGRFDLTGSDRQTYTAEHKTYAKGSDLGGENGGLRVAIKDGQGREVANAIFDKNTDGTYSGHVNNQNGPRGLGRALYDYVHQGFGDIRPSSGALGQTPQGRAFWARNAEFAARKQAATGNRSPAWQADYKGELAKGNSEKGAMRAANLHFPERRANPAPRAMMSAALGEMSRRRASPEQVDQVTNHFRALMGADPEAAHAYADLMREAFGNGKVGELTQTLKAEHFQRWLDNEISESAKRAGVIQASVRRHVERSLQEGVEISQTVTQDQGANRGLRPGPVAGTAQVHRGQPETGGIARPLAPAGGSQAGGNELSAFFGVKPEQRNIYQEGMTNTGRGWVGNMPQPPAKPLYEPKPPTYQGKKLTPQQQSWHEAASGEGLDTDQLHHDALSMMRHDQEHADEINRLRSEIFAKRPDLRTLQMRNAGGKIDSSMVRALDVLADGYAHGEYRDLFDRHGDLSAQLYDMLTQGRAKPDVDGAYRHVLDGMLNDKIEKEMASDVQEEVQRGTPRSEAEEAVRQGALAETSGPDAGKPAAVGDAYEPPGSTAGEFPAPAATNGAGQPGPTPGATSGQPTGPPAGIDPGRGGLGDLPPSSQSMLGDFLKDESGTLDPNKIQDWLVTKKDQLARVGRYLADNYRELAGNMFPRLTRISPESGNALARVISAPSYARLAAPIYLDKILGKNATPGDRLLAGAVLTERRLRYMKQAYIRAGDMASARKVTSIIGQEGSPLASQEEYRRALASPMIDRMMRAWNNDFVPALDDMYRRAQGMDVEDPINSFTQIPGSPVNLKAFRPGDELGASIIPTGGSRGNLKNVKLRKFVFAEQATGAAAGYDIDLGNMIENSLSRGFTVAAKAEWARQMVQSGAARWGVPGAKVEGAKEVPWVNPPQGTQENTKGQTSLYVDEAAYGEVRQALQVDQPLHLPVITDLAPLFNYATLASTVEAAFHGKNMLTFLMKPGIRPQDFVRNIMGVWSKTPGVADRLLELARIGAHKPSYENAGLLGGGKWDPTRWMSRALDFMRGTMELTANDAFNRLVSKKLTPDTEGNRRDFINQLGNYNRASQQKIVLALRDSGIGPFATAGTNYWVQKMRGLTMNPGTPGTGWTASARMRGETLAKTLALIGLAIPILNKLMWNRWDGDDDTPFASIKIGTDANGRTRSIGLGNLIGFVGGLRETGLLALIEGTRRGQPIGQSFDRGVENIAGSLLHPAEGPLVSFAHTALTGTNAIGMKLADKVPADQSHTPSNLMAALRQANPIVGAMTTTRRGDMAPIGERLNQLAGPFGLQYRGGFVSDLQRRYNELATNRTAMTQRGERFPDEREYRILSHAHQRIQAIDQSLRGLRRDGSRLRPGNMPQGDDRQYLLDRQRDISRQALEAVRGIPGLRQTVPLR